MNTFLAAAVQLNSRPELNKSMELVREGLEQAIRNHASFIALPENFAFLGDEKEKHRQAEKIADTVLDKIPMWAKEHGVYILAGGFPVRAKSGKVYNRAIMTNPDGDIIAQYDKIHLFDITLSEKDTYRESALVEAGQPEAVICEISLGGRPFSNREKGVRDSGACFGLSICYDVRFPELYRRLTGMGAEVLCIPSAFTRPTGEAHWGVLLRARAIENSAYVIAPAQTGRHSKKRTTYGHSMIIDPWGKVLADSGTEPGIVLAEIDLGYLREIRQKLPSLQHRIL